MSAGKTEQIRQFLMKMPRPDAVRISCTDGETQDFAVPANVRFATLAKSIVALDPVTISLFDAKGALIRAMKGDEGAEEEKTAPPAPAAHEQALPEFLHGDPETARFALVARLLADAHKFATGVAFQKLAEITDMLSRRMDLMEAKADRSEERYREEVYDRIDEMLAAAEEKLASEEGGAPGDILSTFASAMQAGRQGKPPPNGAAPRRRTKGRAAN